jgi:hypothetical protein
MDFELGEEDLREMIVNDVATVMQMRVLKAELEHAEAKA